MICPMCRRNRSVTVYSTYVATADLCRCQPQEDVMHATGRRHPNIAYAKMAPPLSVQAAMDREVAMAPPLPAHYTQYVPIRTDTGDIVRHAPARPAAPHDPGGPLAPAAASGAIAFAAPFGGASAAAYSQYRLPPPPPMEGHDAGGYGKYRGKVPPMPAAPALRPRRPQWGTMTRFGTLGRLHEEDHDYEDLPQTLFDLVTIHLNWSRLIEPPGYEAAAKLPMAVRYLRTPGEREPFRVTVAGGRATYRGRQMDTTGARKVLGAPNDRGTGPMGDITNRFIYVMSVDGDIFAADASGEYKRGGVFDQAEFGVSVGNTHSLAAKFGGSMHGPKEQLLGFHHTSFLAGGEIACAGEIEVYDGTIVSINNNSGHYTPPPECLLAVVARLEECGVDVGRLRIGINVSKSKSVHGGIEYYPGISAFADYLVRRPPEEA